MMNSADNCLRGYKKNTSCNEIGKLLPWLVNGTLKSNEKIIVFQHLAECTDCRKELAFIISLQRATNEHCSSKCNLKFSMDAFAGITKEIGKQEASERAQTEQSKVKTIQRKDAWFQRVHNIIGNVLFGNVKAPVLKEYTRIIRALEPAYTGMRSYARFLGSFFVVGVR